MTDLILIVILAVILGAAARYVYKAKKRGATCIGCSAGEGGCCCSKTSTDTSSCNCGCQTDSK